jgi:hypothetical protein
METSDTHNPHHSWKYCGRHFAYVRTHSFSDNDITILLGETREVPICHRADAATDHTRIEMGEDIEK